MCGAEGCTWGSAGALGGVVDVAAGAIPVAGHGLGVEGALHVVHLAQAVHDIPAWPQPAQVGGQTGQSTGVANAWQQEGS